MAYEIEFDPATEILHLAFRGHVGINDVNVAAEEAWKQADAQGGYRFLTEFKDVEMHLLTEELLSIHKHYEDIGVRKYIKSAILMSADVQVMEDATVHDYAATMDMWQVRVFFDRVQAVGWLLE